MLVQWNLWFQDSLNPLWGSGFNKETTSNCFYHCPLFHVEWSTLLNNVKEIDSTILNRAESVVAHILLYSDESFKDEVNLLIVNPTVHFVLSTNRFHEPLYLLWIKGFKSVKVFISFNCFHFSQNPNHHDFHSGHEDNSECENVSEGMFIYVFWFLFNRMDPK